MLFNKHTVFVVALTLAGCLSTSPQQEHIYSLTSAPRRAQAQRGPSVAIESLKTGPGYDSEAMAYRVGETELRYYIHRKWAAEPAKLVADALVRNLRASGRFGRVKPADEMLSTDLSIGGTVEAIEQVEHLDARRWQARLALSLVVRDERRQRVLFDHEFDRTAACARNDPAEVASVISQILTDETQKLVRRIDLHLSRPRAKQPSSRPAVPR